MELTHLFSPLAIGNLTLQNRIAMLPMGTSLAEADGNPSDALIDYYAARSWGGAGLVIVEITMAHVTSRAPHTLGLYDDAFIPRWSKLAAAVHEGGAKIFPQLAHQGRQTRSKLTGYPLVAASAIACPWMREMPRELTKDGIAELVEGFGQAARRAQEAGCDGVEIHGAHGYLVCNFMSPLTNKRTDEYGATLSGRMRFPLEIVAAVKEKCGSDFPLSFRFSIDELLPGGIVPQEAAVMALLLADGGADIISLSRANYGSFQWLIPPYGTPMALNAEFAGRLKQTLKVPILVGHRIPDPLVAEQVLRAGQADLIGMGRALLADPDLPRKASEGRLDEIIPCIGCNQGCVGRLMEQRLTASCLVNPTAGREREMPLIPAKLRKKVLVAGGGVAGMECARVAALRGHEVTLCEKSERLGGQFYLAAIPPLKQEFSKAVRYLSEGMPRAGVRVELNRAVTPQVVAERKPDVVVVATGSIPLIPPGIAGTDKSIVTTALELLAGKAAFAGPVVVVGGGLVGCEVAEYLSERGIGDITVLEMLPEAARDMTPRWNRMLLLERLSAYGVKVVTSATVREILDDGVVFTAEGAEQSIRGVGRVVLAAGATALDELSSAISNLVAEIHVIGDARQVRKAIDAIEEGAVLGRKI
ncbi:MAG: FAD-dependent oxidoreductase [Deltaproteobacteria bacterium]|nr:FAD-dependent oxidoreductase [Deltaproteobacteria bacterium]